MLKRVRRTYEEDTSPGISLKDYLNFYQVPFISPESYNPRKLYEKFPIVLVRKQHGWNMNFCGNAHSCAVTRGVIIWVPVLCSCEQD
jgi:hypothetical protein